jgi:hypothetical protein
MVFRRRRRLSVLTRLREMLWPRMGYLRAARYMGWRVVRLPGSAYGIAGGFAWGAAVSFTPFVGLHFLLSVLGAWATRCNIPAAIIGTVVGNPWTFPFIWALIYRTGMLMLGREIAETPPLETLAALFDSIWRLAGNAVLFVVGLQDSIVSTQSGAAILQVVQGVLWPMFAGSLPYVVIVWFAFYLPLRRLVEAYQRRRLRRSREIAGAAGGDMPKLGA